MIVSFALMLVAVVGMHEMERRRRARIAREVQQAVVRRKEAQKQQHIAGLVQRDKVIRQQLHRGFGSVAGAED